MATNNMMPPLKRPLSLSQFELREGFRLFNLRFMLRESMEHDEMDQILADLPVSKKPYIFFAKNRDGEETVYAVVSGEKIRGAEIHTVGQRGATLILKNPNVAIPANLTPLI